MKPDTNVSLDFLAGEGPSEQAQELPGGSATPSLDVEMVAGEGVAIEVAVADRDQWFVRGAKAERCGAVLAVPHVGGPGLDTDRKRFVVDP